MMGADATHLSPNLHNYYILKILLFYISHKYESIEMLPYINEMSDMWI